MKLVALAALAAALAVPSALAATPTLKGTVGPGYTITLTQNGKHVTKLKAGTYVFAIADKSSIHDFHLIGPGVNKTTSISGLGTFIRQSSGSNCRTRFSRSKPTTMPPSTGIAPPVSPVPPPRAVRGASCS